MKRRAYTLEEVTEEVGVSKTTIYIWSKKLASRMSLKFRWKYSIGTQKYRVWSKRDVRILKEYKKQSGWFRNKQ